MESATLYGKHSNFVSKLGERLPCLLVFKDAPGRLENLKAERRFYFLSSSLMISRVRSQQIESARTIQQSDRAERSSRTIQQNDRIERSKIVRFNGTFRATCQTWSDSKCLNSPVRNFFWQTASNRPASFSKQRSADRPADLLSDRPKRSRRLIECRCPPLMRQIYRERTSNYSATFRAQFTAKCR